MVIVRLQVSNGTTFKHELSLSVENHCVALSKSGKSQIYSVHTTHRLNLINIL